MPQISWWLEIIICILRASPIFIKFIWHLPSIIFVHEDICSICYNRFKPDVRYLILYAFIWACVALINISNQLDFFRLLDGHFKHSHIQLCFLCWKSLPKMLTWKQMYFRVGISSTGFGSYLKREAPPSAITLSTLAAWQWRILKRIRIIGGDGENGAGDKKSNAISYCIGVGKNYKFVY